MGITPKIGWFRLVLINSVCFQTFVCLDLHLERQCFKSKKKTKIVQYHALGHAIGCISQSCHSVSVLGLHSERQCFTSKKKKKFHYSSTVLCSRTHRLYLTVVPRCVGLHSERQCFTSRKTVPLSFHSVMSSVGHVGCIEQSFMRANSV